jgi:hypothetical protein
MRTLSDMGAQGALTDRCGGIGVFVVFVGKMSKNSRANLWRQQRVAQHNERTNIARTSKKKTPSQIPHAKHTPSHGH